MPRSHNFRFGLRLKLPCFPSLDDSNPKSTAGQYDKTKEGTRNKNTDSWIRQWNVAPVLKFVAVTLARTGCPTNGRLINWELIESSTGHLRARCIAIVPLGNSTYHHRPGTAPLTLKVIWSTRYGYINPERCHKLRSFRSRTLTYERLLDKYDSPPPCRAPFCYRKSVCHHAEARVFDSSH